jgi:hypothetical protein
MRSQIQKTPVSNSYYPPAQKASSWQRPFSDPVHDAKQDGTVQSKIAPGAGFNLMQMKLFPDTPTPVQAKLTVGAPGDKYEQEADSMANKVMTMPAPENEEPIQREVLPEEKKEEEVQTKPLAATITPLVQRETTPEEPKEEEEVQAKALSGTTIQRETTPEEPKEEEEVQAKALSGTTIQRETTPEEPKKEEDLPVQAKAESEGKSSHNSNLESQLNGSKGGGSPLPDEVRAFMEPRFGADFSGVRVHTDSAAVQMNKELGAQAFAHGSDIYYGAGKSPGKDELTAHELTHVVQQNGGAAGQQVQKNKANGDEVTEVEPGVAIKKRGGEVVQRVKRENVKVAQDSVMKHFTAANVEGVGFTQTNQDAWESIAKKIHQERFGGAGVQTNKNTLIVLTDEAWDQLKTGTLFSVEDTQLMDVVGGGELKVPLMAESVAGAIQTEKANDEYKVVEVNWSGPRFMFSGHPTENGIEINHFNV